MKDSLIFEWPGRHHLHLILPVAVVLAALLHVGLFFVFSIISPRPENTGLDPAQVFFVPPGTPDAARLESLLRSSDPSVFGPGRGLELAEPIPPVTYTPQSASDKLLLDPLPRHTITDIPHPSLAGPVAVRRESLQSAGASAPAPPTKLVSSGPLSGRIPDLPQGTVFPIPRGFDPEPAVFLVSVRGDGRTVHIFQQQSSGNSALDFRAADLLRGLRFAPDPAESTWGFVTFQWGSDIEAVVPQ